MRYMPYKTENKTPSQNSYIICFKLKYPKPNMLKNYAKISKRKSKDGLLKEVRY